MDRRTLFITVAVIILAIRYLAIVCMEENSPYRKEFKTILTQIKKLVKIKKEKRRM